MFQMKDLIDAKTVLAFLFLALLFTTGGVFAQVSYGNALVHETDNANTWVSLNSPSTTLDNPLTNHQEEKVLFVTQNISDGGVVNNHPIGVKFHGGKWSIHNLDRHSMPKGAKFNVLALPRDNPNVYVHQNRNRGQTQIFTGSYDTRLRHPKLDGKPNAKFIISHQLVALQRANSNGMVSNPHEVEIYYKNGYWYIYNKNRQLMPEGCIFNVYINSDIQNSVNSNIQTSSGVNRGSFHIIDRAECNNKPDKLLFTTAVVSAPGTASNESTALIYTRRGHLM